jgi:ParB family chromosome partitioning protein
MNKPQRGLGRGLDALFRGQQESEISSSVQMLSVTDVRPNPEQPRQIFSEDTLAELAESIRTQGVLQPILVRPLSVEGEGKYEIVAGERRWRASQLAGQRTIPAMVREMSAEQALAIALIENLQREDLNPMEEAAGFRELRDRFGLSQDEISSRVGKSRSAVANMLRLFNLPKEIQEDLQSGRMTQGHARPLLAVDDQPVLLKLRQYILDQAPSVREVENRVTHWKHSGELPFEVIPKTSAAKKSPAAPGNEQLAMQDALASVLGLPVRISGTLHKGRVSIVFNSPEELTGLNSRLGLK